MELKVVHMHAQGLYYIVQYELESHHRLRLSSKFLARIRFLKRLSGKFRSR